MSPIDLGSRIRQLRGKRTLADVNDKAKIGVSKLSKLERGDERNPRLSTLERVANGLGVEVGELFTSRPGEAGHAERSEGGGGAGLADSLGRALHEYEQTGEVPRDWRGDVLVAIFALTRALQRPAVAGEPARQNQEAQR